MLISRTLGAQHHSQRVAELCIALWRIVPSEGNETEGPPEANH